MSLSNVARIARTSCRFGAIAHTRTINREKLALRTKQQVIVLLENVLGISGRLSNADESTPLLGAIPELDSMAVATVLTALEERFDFLIDDDEIDGSAFATIGSLVSFVERKIDELQQQGNSVPLSISQA